MMARSGRLAGRRAAGLVIATAWACFAPGRLDAQTAPVSPAPSVLVVPFDSDAREPRSYWLREASAVLLTDDLAALGVSAMSRDERLSAFEALRVPGIASLTHATVIRVAQVVGATRVVVGSCSVRDGGLTVRARSIQLEGGRMTPEIVETGPLSDIFDVYARVARRLAIDMPRAVPAGEQDRTPVAAFEQYIKGLLAEAPAMKIAFLREALRLDPSLARARIAIWGVHTQLGEYQSAWTAVRQVASGNRLEREARFLSSVSMLQLERYQEAFTMLSELNRTAPDASLLNNLGVVQLRRPPGSTESRAVAFFKDAAAVGGSDSDLYFNLGYAYWLDRDVPNAIQALREAVRRNPADDAAHYVLGVALQASGNAAEGARERELARQLSSEYAAWEAKQPAPNTVPKGLERVLMDLTAPGMRRVETELVAAGQRNQQELATFHLEAGRRAYQGERDVEAIAELRRAVYLSPYDPEAHLLLGRAYLRGNRASEAIDELKISVWSRDTTAARLALAEAYILDRNVAAARVELQAVLAREASNTEARRLLDRLKPE
jgi:tetratricopeptide (TPR) repeat protein